MLGMFGVDDQRHLVRAERALDLQPSTIFGPVHPLGDLRTIIGQRGRVASPCRARSFWIAWICPIASSTAAAIRRCISSGSSPSTKSGVQPHPLEELFEFFVLDAGQHRGVADLEAVEMQDRQDRAIRDGIEEFVGLPGRRQRTGLRLAVADDAGDDQFRIVEGRAEGMAQRIAELAAFVNRSRRRRSDMARYAAGK